MHGRITSGVVSLRIGCGGAPASHDAERSTAGGSGGAGAGSVAAASSGGGGAPACDTVDAGAGEGDACGASSSPFATDVAATCFGQGQAFGQTAPEAVLGPPRGGGPTAGSTDVVSLGNGGT